MIKSLFRTLAPLAVAGSAVLLSACDGPNININIGDEDAVPLAELDTSGPAPTKLVLAGPDDVVVSDGAKLAIAVSGDPEAVAALRFSLADGTLGISRESADWKGKGHATVRVTMPAPDMITLAGSGSIAAASLAGKSELVIVGSGKVAVAKVAAKSLELTIGGSGQVAAQGAADTLELNLAGSGSADMAALKVGSADVTVAGSGDAEFASDGTVKASIMGSGTVTVLGKARCKVEAMGSGTLRCENVSAAAASAAPTPPAAPAAPETPAAP